MMETIKAAHAAMKDARWAFSQDLLAKKGDKPKKGSQVQGCAQDHGQGCRRQMNPTFSFCVSDIPVCHPNLQVRSMLVRYLDASASRSSKVPH